MVCAGLAEVKEKFIELLVGDHGKGAIILGLSHGQWDAIQVAAIDGEMTGPVANEGKDIAKFVANQKAVRSAVGAGYERKPRWRAEGIDLVHDRRGKCTITLVDINPKFIDFGIHH